LTSGDEQHPWRPAATLAVLAARAAMLAAARSFFAARNVQEADVPALVPHGVTDPQIASLRVSTAARPGAPLYLHSSPELALKRLLAAGSPDLYFLGKVYRDGERGRHHQPEFTLIEWYRRGMDLGAIIAETNELLCTLASVAGNPPALCEQWRFRDAFAEATGLDPLTASLTGLRDCAGDHLGELPGGLGEDRNAWLDLLMSHVVIPALPREGLTVVTHYPAAQAALARLDPTDATVAERFEVFWRGLELANGYRELTDVAEQGRRFATDREARRAADRPDVEPDPAFLAALGAGLPDCCGVALGFDRVVMLSLGLAHIEQAVSFPL
jgi:lysyl-tRNA synthetase class 2